jgi:hypothetical protein
MRSENRKYIMGAILTILFYSALFLIASTPLTDAPYFGAHDTR